ncbi:MAG: PAS domain S-box protein [Hyphomicrobiales bacterium]|nr:PAS domain S-box protein [Hyphomicrobiales bacterium]
MNINAIFGLKEPTSDQHRRVLEENDRRGERAIAWSQAVIALIVFGFHLIAAVKSTWETFSPLTVGVASAILVACMIRLGLSTRPKMPERTLHLLSVVDGILIYMLITSYSFAYDLPVEASFKAPSLVFLLVYTSVRVLKLDPLPVLISGGTVLVGWVFLTAASVYMGAPIAASYVEFVSTSKVMIGANVEMGLGFFAIVLILAFAAAYARGILADTADREELAAAKASAESSAARFGAVIQSTTDGILVVDQNGIIEQVNPALEQMFEHTAHDLCGNSAAVLMAPENAEKLAGDIALFLQSGMSNLVGRPFESEGITRHGRTFPIELSISDFKVGGVQFFTGIIRDISSRFQAMENERAARARYKEVVTSALDAIVVINEGGTIVEFNPAAEEIFGFKGADVIGRELAQTIVPGHHREAHRAGMDKYLTTGEGPVLNQRIEIDAVTADARSITIELAIMETKGPEGRLFIGYMRDITDAKAAEAALVEAKERAEVANRAKASFLAMMSHEIRTPLNGVLGVLTLLSDNVKKPDNVRAVKTARRSGKALLAIINDILDFSKLEAGKLDLEPASFHTDILVDSIASLVRLQSQQKRLETKFSVNDNVPDVLHGDQDRIRQVLLNLVWNALKFTEEGHVHVNLVNVGTANNLRIRFTIEDTGIGVPDDRSHELFTEFATIDASYARKFGGTGLGLSICKALTTAMGGEIGYQKNKPRGSVFWFELPLEKGDPSKVVEEESLEAAQQLLEGKSNIRILLAEDNVTNQLVVGTMLERLGCTVDTVANGQEAVDSVFSRNYDAVLMDVSMPEMDGIEATKIIRSMDGEASKLPIIALTAYALDEDRQKVLAAGMDDFASKPVSRIELARVLARQIDGKRAMIADPQAEAPEKPALFDEATLASVFADIDDGLRQRIVDEFKNDVNRHLDALSTARESHDETMYERATHGLKGVSGTFGATELSRLAANANTLIRQGKADDAYALAGEIDGLSHAILASVEKRLSTVDAGLSED